jgi:hypothetical protein
MQLLMENPAAANCGAPKSDLAGASINSKLIASLPLIQAYPVVGRKFALDLAARVFGHAPRADAQRDAVASNLVVTVNGKRFAPRDCGIKVKKGPVSRRLGGEYIYGTKLQRAKAEDWNADLLRRIKAQGLTAGFFGDPPPGRSALDKKRKEDLPDGLIDPQSQCLPHPSSSEIRAWRAPA